ncbi:hypothetical protein B7494_g3831 [Chlorociboria aeruginascens]|nr:hypothetical protein B7494_g3831 [Chlorociboria aeruginascens]
MSSSPKILRPMPRRPYDLNTTTPEPPSPLLAENNDPTETPSRTHSILNLTSSTLLGIYSPAGYNMEREESSISLGTGAETPIRARPSPIYRQISSPAPTVPSTSAILFSLTLRSMLLFGLGMLYGLLVRHLHDDRQLAPFQVEGIIKPSNDWRYLVFWGVAGVAFGSLLPWVDTLWDCRNSEGSQEKSGGPEGEQEVKNSEGILGADWAPAVRSIKLIVKQRRLPWTSTLQASLTLALVNPVLWYIIDRSKPGFILSTAVGATGTAIILVANPDMIASPASSRARNSTLENHVVEDLRIGPVSVFSKNGCRDRNIMSKVGVADRSRLLRSKHAELRYLNSLFCMVAERMLRRGDAYKKKCADYNSGIVTSRKRKLREFFAVCDEEGPLPQFNILDSDASALNAAEAHFLDVSDILQNRLFDESNLPTRRFLRSDNSKSRSPIRKNSPDSRAIDASRKPGKGRDASNPRKNRAPTPSSRSDHENGAIAGTEENGDDPTNGVPMQISTSKGSQTDLPAESATVLNEIVEKTFEAAERPQPETPDITIPPEELEKNRIETTVESRAGSPGVDPQKTMPLLPEDAAQLPRSVAPNSQEELDRPATVHLPPKEVQEQRLRSGNAREKEEADRLSIHLPPRDGRIADALSSPGSTVDALSATTPALHDASTDTSPENDISRYEPERLEKDDVQTPTEAKPIPETAENGHGEISKFQDKPSPVEAPDSSSTAADTQLWREEQAASGPNPVPNELHDSQADDSPIESQKDNLTKKADELMQDTAEDHSETAAPSPKDAEMTGVEPAPESKQKEVADSEADDQTPVDAMDVDTPAIQDSFESNAPLDSVPSSSPVVPPLTVPPTRPRIDTGNKLPSVSIISTPSRTLSTPVSANTPIERMTTRVASGAMRHKSVSEILGETPRPTSTVDGKGLDSANTSSSRSATPQSPGSRTRSLLEKERNKEKERNDYYLPLFIAGAQIDKKGFPTLDGLMQTAHKTLTTANAYVPIYDSQATKILKRIYNLQSANKWSLRQPKRSQEPNRPTTHWDVLLQEAKWMRTDFREERKWKMTVARNLASACAEWVNATEDDRKLLQIKAAILPIPDSSKDVEMGDVSQDIPHETPDLVASGEFDSPMEDYEEPRLNLLETVAPTAIFGLQDDEVVFGLRRSPTTDKLLDELPMYNTPLQIPESDLPTSEIDPDRFWRRPALPLSKFVEGLMVLKNEGPPRKKSRYEYAEEDDDEDTAFDEQDSKRLVLPPEKTDVALFNPENRHIRDRIHAGHQFRPPSEHPMPQQSFFESRVSSQWTWSEDDYLKSVVRDYCYNWSLISDMLKQRSLFSSGAERRTPWECFERWIQLEGLPADMGKTGYFRAYNNRIEAAQRNVTAQATQPGPNGVMRRRHTGSIRVDRRKDNKHITLVDSMRKLAKKRETNQQKQLQGQQQAQMRKANEVPQQRGLIPQTPQEFSRVKHDRDEQIKERMAFIHNRNETMRRQARAGQPQQGLPNGGPSRPPTNGAVPNTPSGQNLTVPGQSQNRPRGPLPPQMAGQAQMPNGLRVPQMPMNGVPQAPMGMQNQIPMPNPGVSLNLNLVTQASQIADMQRQRIASQHGNSNQSPLQNSPPRGMMQPGFLPNNMIPNYPNTNGSSTPPSNNLSTPSGQSGSPRMNQPPQQLSSGMIPHVTTLEAQIRARNPNASPEEIRRQLTDQLGKTVQSRQATNGLAQSAMNAAAGGGIAASPTQARVPSGMENNPQLYAQMLRQQQHAQMTQNSAGATNSTSTGANGNVASPVAGNAAVNGNTRPSTAGSAQGK